MGRHQASKRLTDKALRLSKRQMKLNDFKITLKFNALAHAKAR
jgi:hypothetical protein